MNRNAKKRLISLVLVICMLVGIAAILPIRIPVSAADIPTSNNYFFKVGAKSALANGTRKTFAEAPFIYEGEVYIPVSALTAVKGTPAGGIETKNGISAVNLKNMSSAYSGFYGSISNMNLIAVSTTQNFFTANTYTSDEQVALMKMFIYDAIDVNGSTQLTPFDVNDMQSLDHPYLYANQTKFNELRAVYQAGQAGEAVDEVLYAYLCNFADAAQRLYTQYAKIDENDNYVSMNTTVGLRRGHHDYIYQIPYSTTGSGGGYDEGGRQSDAANHNSRIMELAFGYQITGNVNYAKLAYQYAIYIGQWEHWGPGHMLNAADAASPYAVAYDWLYDVWTELEAAGETYLYYNGSSLETRTVSVAAIEEVLFTHAIVPAYYSIAVPTKLTEEQSSGGYKNKTGVGLPWQSATAGIGGYDYHTDPNNWNAVCAAGFTIAALALVGKTTSTSDIKIDTNATDKVYNATTDFTTYLKYTRTYTEGSGCNAEEKSEAVDLSLATATYQAYAEWLVNQNIYYLPLNGLGQYSPDGSYIESNGYWAYGTNNLYKMAAALTSTTGNDYGLLQGWGMEKTAYFALNTMSSDGLGYNFHDSNTIGAQDTSMFMYLGSELGLGDKALAGIRRDLNATISGQRPSMYDILYYMDEAEIGEFEYPELQYYMEGIDGYVVRDGWNSEDGTLFGAFMGQENNFGHAQVDSGAFVYYNKGVRWFCDLGTEEYNAYEFWHQPYRARYYAMGPEGNNTVIIKGHESDTFFGQYLGDSDTRDAGGIITKTGSNDFGAFAVMNNTSAYKTSSTNELASSAYRGMLLTNDHKTFVIQDQMSFNSAEDVAWVGHIAPGVEVMLSVDKTVAYLSDGKTSIKVTIVEDPGDSKGLTFRHAYCTDDEFLLDNTQSYDFSTSNGDETPNKDYSSYQKLIIEASGVTSFNVAVVIEEVVLGTTMNDADGLGYTWTDMNSWNPTDDTRVSGDGGESGEGGETESGPVATVTITEVDNGEYDSDTPIIDFFGSYTPVALAAEDDVTLGETTEYTVESFEELEALINDNKGNIITVDLKRSNSTPIEISAECTVNSNGKKLLATSTNLIARVSGDTVSYEKGTVTVTWVLSNGTKVTETYTSAMAATYKGSISASSTIYEKDNGDGTYSYYTTGSAWSTTDGGAQASSNDLIVTSENCTFYQTKIPFDGLFVGVASNGNITGYYKADDFFSQTFRNTAYERISVTNDFSYDATAKTDFHGVPQSMIIYLNGHTVTYTSADKSDHMFTPTTGTNLKLHIYGPGSMINEASGSNFISGSPSAGASVLIENVDIYSTIAVIDHRYGTAIFRDCTVTVEKNASAFGANNRNNAAVVAPHVIVDGCIINVPNINANNGVGSVQLNAKVEFTGGTIINAGSQCSLFKLSNSTTNYTGTFDYATGYSEMYAIIGEVYHNLNSLYVLEHNDSAQSGNSSYYDMSGRVFYGEGYSYTEGNAPSAILSGLVSAKDSETTYVIANPANCATVQWRDANGTVKATESWLAGTIPSPSASVKALFSSDSTKIVSFPTREVVAGETASFDAAIVDAFGLKVNMSLQTDFHLNFFIENKGDMTFKIDGVTVTADTTSMSGYYKVAKTNIDPASAGKTVKLEVTYNGVTISKNISVVDYARKILADSTYSDELRGMMINIIKYIDAAYVYAGNQAGDTAKDYAKVNTLYKDYRALATVSVVDRQTVNTAAVSDAIASAQLYLTDTAKFRFNIKSTYNGTLTINGTAYEISNGKYGTKTYIDVSIKAFDMLEPITLQSTGDTVNYSLANYYHYYATEAGAFTNLLNALYSYCETAKIYQATV